MDDFALNTIPVLVLDRTEDGIAAVRAFARSWSTPLDLVETNTVETCLWRLSRGRFEVALIDIDLPEVLTNEFGGILRRNGRILVAATSSSGLRPAAALKALRAYDLLLKPYRRDALENLFRIHERVSSPMRALIVDGSATIRHVIKRVIAMSAFAITVDEAGDGPETLERVKEAKRSGAGYDMLVIDLDLPGCDSADLIRRVRAVAGDPYVVAISGEPEPVIRRRVPTTLCGPFLQKPFFPADLDRNLRRLYGLPEPIAAATDGATSARPAAR